MREPCLCGADDCWRCYPERKPRIDLDDQADDAYDTWVQEQLDDEMEERCRGSL